MAVGIVTMLLGMVVALTLVLAGCGWAVDEAASGTVIGKIEQSELVRVGRRRYSQRTSHCG